MRSPGPAADPLAPMASRNFPGPEAATARRPPWRRWPAIRFRPLPSMAWAISTSPTPLDSRWKSFCGLETPLVPRSTTHLISEHFRKQSPSTAAAISMRPPASVAESIALPGTPPHRSPSQPPTRVPPAPTAPRPSPSPTLETRLSRCPLQPIQPIRPTSPRTPRAQISAPHRPHSPRMRVALSR